MNYLDYIRYWLPATLAWRLNRTTKMWMTTLFFPFNKSSKDVDSN